jgi:L-ascorbate metabolism protein UlaG (beta-lactamase superfamily)
MADIVWLGHDSFKLKSADGKVVYIDPWQLTGRLEKADVILITHDHYDHCSPDDVQRVRGDETVVVAQTAAAKKLKGPVRAVKPGDRLTARGIEIEAVPAYNVNKRFHPKAAGHVGFVVTLDGERIYHAGDTDAIPEMANLQADIALLPVSGTYVMTAEEAAQAAKKINPRVVIPMHYGAIVGSEADAQRFKQLVAPMEVRILTPE